MIVTRNGMNDDKNIDLIITVPEELVCSGFERPFTEEEKDILIKAIGNGTKLPKGTQYTLYLWNKNLEDIEIENNNSLKNV